MGQQQLLLIILGVIIVGVAIAGGIALFKSQAMGQNRDAIWADLNQIGARAQAFYRRPVTLGGGGKSFSGFTLLKTELHNDNGVYAVTSVSAAELVLSGTGTEIGNNDTSPVFISLKVQADTMFVNEALIN